MKGMKKVNITAMAAAERMLYMSVLRSMAVNNERHMFFSPVDGWLSVMWLRRRIHFFGSRFSTYLYAGAEARIMYGVRNVVMTLTATTTGYRKSPITPSERPNEAMMNENSPICAIEKPHCIADFSD